MANDLFRKEALEAKHSSWLGGISLAQPVRHRLFAVAAAIVALAVILFLSIGTYTRRSTVMGQLVPTKGLALVLAPATGIISKLTVAEGQRVSAGQTLAVLLVPRATLNGGDTAAALSQQLQQRESGLSNAHQAQAEMLKAQTDGLQAQLSSAQQELRQIEAEIATRADQVHLARESLKRLQQLEQNQFVSQTQIEQQKATALEQVSAMQALQRQAVSTRRAIAQLQQAQRELPGQQKSLDANYQRDQALLQQEQLETEARSELVLVSPVEGVVTTPVVKSGQAVQVGQTVLSVLPGDGELQAELQVPSRAIGFIDPQDAVLLRYQAFPYQKFGHQQGQVAQISRSAITTDDLEPFYRVTVKLSQQSVLAYGKNEALKPGMLLEADVLGEQRRLIEWIFEPLYSLNGRVFDR